MGIDGGGTKTIAVIADMNGFVVAKSQAGPTNPNVMPISKIKQTFKELMNELRKQVPIPYENVNTLFAGMSGAGSKRSKHILKGMIQEAVPHISNIGVEIDTINALYSGTYGGPGIVQIAGTGAITYGVNNESKHDRIGGWGYLFGDEGSGYDIGRRAVIAALKYYDGRGIETTLLNKLYTYFDVKNPREIIEKIYASRIPKVEIAPLSKVVFEAYKQNDIVAKELLYDVVEELELSIKTLYSKLFQPNEEVIVVLCGGVFNDNDVLPPLITNKLQYGNMKITIPIMSPVGGSIIGAYIMQHFKPNSKIIEAIAKTI